MKDFKDIQEGLLRGMEDTLDAGENAAQQVLKDQMLKYFVTNAFSLYPAKKDSTSPIKSSTAPSNAPRKMYCSMYNIREVKLTAIMFLRFLN